MDTSNNYRDSDNYRDVLARAHLHIANEMAKLGICDIHDLVKLLLESDDLATANKVLGPILFAASGFYNRHDDDASCRALRMAHGIITVNINGPDKYMTEIFADMAVVARFLFEWLEGGRNETRAAPEPPPETNNGATVISLLDRRPAPSTKMTVAELIALLNPPSIEEAQSDATLETVHLYSILAVAVGLCDDRHRLIENALCIAMYAVRGGGINEASAKAMLSHIESLTDDMADMEALTPATRNLCEAIADLIGPEFNEPVMVPVGDIAEVTK